MNELPTAAGHVIERETAIPEEPPAAVHAVKRLFREAPEQAALIDALPLIRREGIEWTGGVESTPLTLRLTFENPGPVPTVPAPAEVRIAVFGAFLPWRPLTQATVPAIPPRRRTVVTATVGAPLPSREQPLGRAEIVRLRRRLAPLVGRQPDVLLGGPSAGVGPRHLAANIDVRVGHRRPVERHFGCFPCLRAGHTNLVVFKIGDGQSDTYTLTVPERPAEWSVRVCLPGVEARDDELTSGISVELTTCPVFAGIDVGREATSGRVVFGVARASTHQSTTVELELAPIPAAR